MTQRVSGGLLGYCGISERQADTVEPQEAIRKEPVHTRPGYRVDPAEPRAKLARRAARKLVKTGAEGTEARIAHLHADLTHARLGGRQKRAGAVDSPASQKLVRCLTECALEETLVM